MRFLLLAPVAAGLLAGCAAPIYVCMAAAPGMAVCMTTDEFERRQATRVHREPADKPAPDPSAPAQRL